VFPPNVLYDDVCLSQEGEDDLVWRIWKVWTRKERDGECAKVLTMYKRKDKKVNQGDAPLYGGVKSGGGPLDWIESVTGKKVNAGKVVPRGSRLTPERLAAMNIGGGTLCREEVELVQERVLFQFEGAITFKDVHMGQQSSPPSSFIRYLTNLGNNKTYD
jgi:hypothetical protein